MPTSSEFIELCQSQVALLTQGLGAAFSVVYLREELVDGATTALIPLVVYPETGVVWDEALALAVLPEQTGNVRTPIGLLGAAPKKIAQTTATNSPQIDLDREQITLLQQRQIFLPLIHEGVVMGLLVTGRSDRRWNQREQNQIEQIAHTLALACILDQRLASSQQRHRQQMRLVAQQRDILDDLLHQFRNPLTALRTFGKLLLKRLLPDDANRQVATGIVRESDRLQEFLQQFDLAIDMTSPDRETLLMLTGGSDAGYQPPPATETRAARLLNPSADWARTALTLESCSVAEVLEPLLISATAIALERNLNIISQISPHLPPVLANANALREVLSNLIDNALKYTSAGGEINIQIGEQCRKTQGVYQAIAISDSGAGIPPQDLEHIFERHYRGVQGETGIQGTGLGLAIAKELVEKMQGEIEVTSPAKTNWAEGGDLKTASDALGAGTTVIVWLPVAQ